MNVYFSIFKNQVKKILQYRAAAISGIITQLFFGFIRIEALNVFYQSSSGPKPISFESSVTYIWISQMCISLVAQRADDRVKAMIRDGSIAYELTRPFRISLSWYAISLGNRLTLMLMRAIPLLIVILFLPNPYTITINLNSLQLISFLCSITLGILLAAAFNNIFNILTLYLMTDTGIIKSLVIFAQFSMGHILPLPLFPEWIKPLIYALPFAGLIDYPIQILTGMITGQAILYVVAYQIFWIIIFFILADKLMQHKLKNIMLQGG